MRANQVVSVEEIVGLLESSPADVAEWLGWSQLHTRLVLMEAISTLPEDTRYLFETARGREHPYGAVEPPETVDPPETVEQRDPESTV